MTKRQLAARLSPDSSTAKQLGWFALSRRGLLAGLLGLAVPLSKARAAVRTKMVDGWILREDDR